MAPTFKWNDRVLSVYRAEYQYGSGDQLAILAFDENDEECCIASGMPYGVLTVNLGDNTQWTMALAFLDQQDKWGIQYVDINNWPGIEWVLDHDPNVDWLKPVGVKTRSGFVTYPLYAFDLNKIPHI